MATTANLPPGAIPTNGMSDPFVSASSNSAGMRFAPFDTDQFSLYSTSSPSQAKRALEAHLKDTDRRLQDASKLGNNLVQQRKDLAARLKDIEQIQQDDEVPPELRSKLAELEREYNEIGRESARAFLPKPRVASSGMDPSATPSAFTGSGRESPTKVSAPSRRQRNQANSRVHDIEFATEISTSLLAQVRSLQAALAQKEDELKDTTSARAQFEAEAAGMVQRIKAMSDSEQRFKDENWNLEMQLQDLQAKFKDSSDKEQRLTQSLKATESDKSAAQRDLDDLKVSHEKLNEEHAVIKRQQETDLHGLRRDVAIHESEKSRLQKRIDELTSQNTELAKAVSSRWNQPGTATDTDFVSAEEDQHAGDSTPEHSEPASPVKGTPRHGMLESETLKSSLNHAHRMIQNLKNNIHREKTEKIELKRMLQDARDELEARRSEGAAGSLAKKRRSDQPSGQFKKPFRPLGANRSSATEILEDEPDWEDHDGSTTPSKSRAVFSGLGGFAAGAAGTAMLDHAFRGDDSESTDAAFETATEREGTTTDAFETGRESMDDDDTDELTETEGTVHRADTSRRVTPLVGARPRDRRSFQSTASTDDEEQQVQTPIQAQQPKYRLRNLNNRGSKRGRVDELSPVMQDSPASSTGTPQPAGQSLGDELDALDDESVEGTPLSTPVTERQISLPPESLEPETGSPMKLTESPPPEGVDGSLAHQANAAMLAHEAVVRKPVYADAGVMTEPWQPEAAEKKQGLREKAGEVVGSALAGFGLGHFTGSQDDDQADAGADQERPVTMVGPPRGQDDQLLESPPTHPREVESSTAMPLEHSGIVSQETEPISPVPSVVKRDIGNVAEAAADPAVPLAAAVPLAVAAEDRENLAFSSVTAQDSEPEERPFDDEINMAYSVPPTPLVPRRSSRRADQLLDEAEYGVPGTDGSRVGAGFFATAGPPVEPKSMSSRSPLGELPPNAASRDSMLPVTKPLQIRKPMADEGSQTTVSGDDIENMMRNKSSVGAGGIAAGVFGGAAAVAALDHFASSPPRPPTAIQTNSPRRSIDGVIIGTPDTTRAPRRPASASSIRNKMAAIPPPLPENSTQKIAAAAQKPTPSTAGAGTMGPPLMPASAYKQNRPRTPAEMGRTTSRDGTTPRGPRERTSMQMNSPAPSGLSRRTSMSSFASELDERFNIQRGQVMYPDGVAPATDPRMIQAITQTMIGEYLWKYTRKPGRSETSTTRHRRFFWVHPYTRTLYWSEKDPSTAGRDMLKAKSVAIEAVRVITDDNTYPPGLHRKSLIVVTPGREIVFTAPTSQRHETWFNALSYLLLRTEQEKVEAEDAINQDDIDEFNPGIANSIRRSITRFAGSRTSLSSYNSRTTRNSSPTRAGAGSSLAQRQSAAAARAKAATPQSPTPAAAAAATTAAAGTTSSSRRYSSNNTRDSSGPGGRLSSLTSRFRPGSAARGSYSSARGRTSAMSSRNGQGIYEASVATESAEDLRAVIENQEKEADRLENVRACCDGKHDVGSLSRSGRYSSLGSRLGGSNNHAHSHTHSHGHAHPKAEPLSVSSRPRRGE